MRRGLAKQKCQWGG